MNKYILITGGTGYIGSHIIIELYNLEYNNIIVVDSLVNSTTENLYNIYKIKNKMPLFYNLDLTSSNDLNIIFQTFEIDTVLHLASLKSVSESISDPIKYYNNNVVGLINLLNIMKINNCKKIIFSSSATVYGNSKFPLCETSPIILENITNPYGQTKYICERIINDMVIFNNFQAIILRYFNPIGYHPSGLIGDNLFNVNLFSTICNLIKNDIQNINKSKNENEKEKALTIFGNNYNTYDGTCIRDFIHVCDLAVAHIKAIEKLNSNTNNYSIYNIGTGIGTSVKELIDTFYIFYPINYTIGNRRNGDVEFSCCDCNKINRELNFYPKYNIHDACEHGYNYLINTLK
jgi:UDP-glucose 4-epimerase